MCKPGETFLISKKIRIKSNHIIFFLQLNRERVASPELETPSTDKWGCLAAVSAGTPQLLVPASSLQQRIRGCRDEPRQGTEHKIQNTKPKRTPTKEGNWTQSEEGKVGKPATASGQAINGSEMKLSRMRSAKEKRQQPLLLGLSHQSRARAHSLLFPYSSPAWVVAEQNWLSSSVSQQLTELPGN